VHDPQPIPEVSHVAGGSDSRTPLLQGRARTKARLPQRASTSATNRNDELSVRGDKNSTMICRKKLHDDLSVRTYPYGRLTAVVRCRLDILPDSPYVPP